MHRQHARHIGAPAGVVWDVWSDVTSWPELIDAIKAVELAPPRLVVGAQARIVQAGIPADQWTVTDLDPGRGWTWEARAPGVVTVATHRVQEEPDGTSTAFARVVQHGAAGRTVGWLFAPLVGRHLRRELDAVGGRSERLARAD